VRAYDSLRGRREFALVLRRGRKADAGGLTVFAFQAPRAPRRCKVGFILTKKVGNAVERNRFRRRCKCIFDQADTGERGHWYVVHATPPAIGLRFAPLRAALLSAVERSSKRALKTVLPSGST